MANPMGNPVGNWNNMGTTKYMATVAFYFLEGLSADPAATLMH